MFDRLSAYKSQARNLGGGEIFDIMSPTLQKVGDVLSCPLHVTCSAVTNTYYY